MEVFTITKLEATWRKCSRNNGAAESDQTVDWFCAAVGYAIDFFRAATLPGGEQILDFTSKTMGQLETAISLSHLHLISQGKYINEIREILIKRLASYMLFTVNNDLREMGLETNVSFSESSFLLSVIALDEKTYSFDFLSEARKTISFFKLSDQGEPTSTFGSVGPMHQQLFINLMEPVFRAGGALE